MSLSERSRSTLYQGLRAVIADEEAVGEMLSHFPARDLDEPVTRDHLRAGLAELRSEMVEFRGEMAELRSEIVVLEQRMAVGFAAVDVRFAEADKRLEERFSAFQKEISAEMRRWHLATLMVIIALIPLARLAG